MENRSTTGTTNNNNNKAEIVCRVCGDKASGKHYGVASCDGCRGFFKRSIRRNLEYVCKENGRCIVDVTRRNQCQACRFRKCLQVNMKRDAVQHERAPRSCIPHHHGPHSNPLSGHLLPLPLPGIGLPRRFHGSFFNATFPLPTIQTANPFLTNYIATNATNSTNFDPTLTNFATTNPYQLNHGGLFYPPMFSPTASTCFRNKLFTSTCNILRNDILETVSSANGEISSEARRTSNDDEVSSSEEAAVQRNVTAPENERLLLSTSNNKIESSTIMDSTNSLFSTNHLLSLHKNKMETQIGVQDGVETFPSFRQQNIDITSPIMLPNENIYESAAKLLFLSVKWAKSIPSFLQLTQKDQSILLEHSWAELFILTASQWSLPIDEAILINNLLSSSLKQLEEDAKKLREVVTRLSLLQIDYTEYACLKALVLFKSDCPQICDPSHVELLQDQTHIMLQEYCNSTSERLKINGDKKPTGVVRFGKLLLALPAVQSISKRSLEELLFKKTIGDVAIERLLSDMIKANS